MVAVVQLVEHQVVILGVAGSSPVSHPEGQRVFSPLAFYFVGRLGPLAFLGRKTAGLLPTIARNRLLALL